MAVPKIFFDPVVTTPWVQRFIYYKVASSRREKERNYRNFDDSVN